MRWCRIRHNGKPTFALVHDNQVEVVDGTPFGEHVPQGTYVWRAEVHNLVDDGKEEFNGYINLIK